MGPSTQMDFGTENPNKFRYSDPLGLNPRLETSTVFRYPSYTVCLLYKSCVLSGFSRLVCFAWCGSRFRTYPKGPSTQIVGFQGPKAIQSMDFGT